MVKHLDFDFPPPFVFISPLGQCQSVPCSGSGTMNTHNRIVRRLICRWLKQIACKCSSMKIFKKPKKNQKKQKTKKKPKEIKKTKKKPKTKPKNAIHPTTLTLHSSCRWPLGTASWCFLETWPSPCTPGWVCSLPLNYPFPQSGTSWFWFPATLWFYFPTHAEAFGECYWLAIVGTGHTLFRCRWWRSYRVYPRCADLGAASKVAPCIGKVNKTCWKVRF